MSGTSGVGSSVGDPRRVAVRVLIRPKSGILDPQGKAVERALPALGFEGVVNLSVGRLIEFDAEDPADVPAMCERLLANPLIEDYEIEMDTPQRESSDPPAASPER